MTDSNQHSERVREALDYALLRVGRELGYYDDILMYRGGKEALDSLEEQVQSLEIACDHHKMFWQKAEERERGLKEQLEAVRTACDRDPTQPWNVDISDYSDEWCHGFVNGQANAQDVILALVSNPASEPESA